MYVKFEAGKKWANSKKSLEKSESITTFDDCGYVLEPNEVVIDIDIDDRKNVGHTKNSILQMLAIEGIETQTVETTRGYHLYFNYDGLNQDEKFAPESRVTIGSLVFDVEFKTVKSNPWVTIKLNGEERKITNEGKRMMLPDCFLTSTTIKKIQPPSEIIPFDGTFDFDLFQKCVKQLKDTGYLDAGGNYHNWFTFIAAVVTMVKEGRLTDNQGRAICTMIDCGDESSHDKYTRLMYDKQTTSYGHVVNVMKSNGITEITKVSVDKKFLRQCQWWEMTKHGEKFLHYTMGDYINDKFQLIRYGDENGILYYYDAVEGYYKMDSKGSLLDSTIRQLDKRLTIHQVREVQAYIKASVPIVTEWDRHHIPAKNGLWNVDQKCLVPFSPDIYLDFKIDVNYNKNAYSSFIDQTLNKISNFHAPTRTNLEEILGAAVSPELLARYAWFLFGRTAHNGKSFFLHLISQLINPRFIGGLSPHDVAKSQFKIAELYGKKVNLIDEIGTSPIPDFDKIKSLITGGFQPIEFKGKDTFTAKIEVVQVWASNFFPNIREEGNQVNRRLEIIPFDFNFNNDPDKLPDTVAENMAKTVDSNEYLLKLAIEGMYRLIENKGDPSPNEKRIEQKEEFVLNNDKLGDWLADTGYDKTLAVKEDGCFDVIDYESCSDIYQRYIEWGTNRGEDRRYMYSKQRLENELMKRFNLKKDRKRLLDIKSGKEDGNAVKRYIRNTG
ncbi:DUF5906 domain-containing protein [Paenibacillus sacheonensis]|uniref:SF3 helicase domain-containing protein n=1 Tax=Paenibacillus sacheonensis TaxID=742054 RepID=A0A7X5C167_9BACL|nr:DUF5906 domain-containing protein [Paenibacillus sacheonensis]MBM7565267.1 phage/plasmid-associated DNA primase [Paenibacillus sacheonensis]NBC69960.1 hypothetical protein [Paenibacillus sacheonensis]